MTSYTRRYLDGDHEGVWADLRGLGAVPDVLVEDCAAVARETMQRVAAHVERLAEQMTALGLVLWHPWTAPTAADHADLDLLAAEIGTLPVAFDACLRYVGAVSFAGDCPALDLWYDETPPENESDSDDEEDSIYPDPLVLPSIDYLRYGWDAYRERLREYPAAILDGFEFEFAPDELHKANISGATHDIMLTQVVADPVIRGVIGRPEISLVEYLRLSISWGGLPGWSFQPDRAPAALADLRRSPDF